MRIVIVDSEETSREVIKQAINTVVQNCRGSGRRTERV